MIPGSVSDPSIVNVLPDPVCPYANTVALYPAHAGPRHKAKSAWWHTYVAPPSVRTHVPSSTFSTTPRATPAYTCALVLPGGNTRSDHGTGVSIIVRRAHALVSAGASPQCCRAGDAPYVCTTLPSTLFSRTLVSLYCQSTMDASCAEPWSRRERCTCRGITTQQQCTVAPPPLVHPTCHTHSTPRHTLTWCSCSMSGRIRMATTMLSLLSLPAAGLADRVAAPAPASRLWAATRCPSLAPAPALPPAPDAADAMCEALAAPASRPNAAPASPLDPM